MPNTIVREDENGKFYKCCSCGIWWKLNLDNMGVVNDDGIFCPNCTKQLYSIELDLYQQFVEEYKRSPTYKQLVCLKRIVWRWIALPLDKLAKYEDMDADDMSDDEHKWLAQALKNVKEALESYTSKLDMEVPDATPYEQVYATA